jgi:UDP-N-acetyl-D-glucosamine dehydrogenase
MVNSFTPSGIEAADNMETQRVVVVGQGYVGLPLAMRALEAGFDVVGYDLDAGRVNRLRSGKSFIEDIDDGVVTAALASGRYRVTTDFTEVDGFDVAVVTVPTPLRESMPDLSFVESSAKTLATKLGVGSTVILESTTYPGTTRELMVPILEDGSGLKAGVDFFVGYSPERIDPGNRVWTFKTTPKVVSGLNEASLEAVAGFYSRLVDRVVPVKGCEEAELTKLIENTFRHVNVALVNELAVFADELGVDLWESIEAASTKPFGFMKFTPGPGVGGHCLPIDPSYLSWRVKQTLGKPFRFVDLANDVNEHMPDYVVRRVTLNLNRARLSVNGSNIVVLGMSYKRNSGDARESPSIAVALQLDALGADVTTVDPHVIETPRALNALRRADLTPELIRDADIVVLLTDHDAFDYDMVVREAKRIFDARHRMPGSPNVELL